jgi:hypothetical protein
MPEPQSTSTPGRAKRKYLLKFGRALLPRGRYHSTKRGAKGYSRPRLKRLERQEREELAGGA